MEGKGVRTHFDTVVMGVLILTLLVAQTQAEDKICCPSITARKIYNAYLVAGFPYPVAAGLCGCKIVSETCPEDYDDDILENSGNAINRILHCKLGCASSMCNSIMTLQNSGEDWVKVEVEKCNNACSEFCTKGSTVAFETS